MTWREYHQATKHSRQSLLRSRHTLDWANMPDPFRHYENVPVLDLPADPPPPAIPTLDLLHGARGTTDAADGAAFLSQLLFHAAAISASKQVPSTGYRYALRVNPSSGNLHPTEFHFLSRGLQDWPDGLYHYRPSSHMAEQRALGQFSAPGAPAIAPLVFLLTSIAWREAWKYMNRAYRYCAHDIGHAWQSLALAAEAMGCTVRALGHFEDDAVAALFRPYADEWPMLLIAIDGTPIPRRPTSDDAPLPPEWFGGEPNRLSETEVDYPLLARMHQAAALPAGKAGNISVPAIRSEGAGEILLPKPSQPATPFGFVARTRRSALDFIGGTRGLSLAQLSALLSAASQPLDADFDYPSQVRLYLYVHRVDELEAGVYRHWPGAGTLEKIRRGDQRVAAAGLSLGQDLAGNACVAFSMIADLEGTTRANGDRAYRYAFFQAGAIGQRLYLAAEALGLRATGIGAFFDDEVHEYLGLTPEDGQVIYHFAIGYPVEDPRLQG